MDPKQVESAKQFLEIWRGARQGDLKLPLDLGTLHAVMKNMPEDAHVVFDGCWLFGKVPGELNSYRGDYADIAVSPDDSPYPVTVMEFAYQLDKAIGGVFYGYKGGEYRMHADSTLWVASYGESTGYQVTDVTFGDGMVMMHVEETYP